MEAHKHRRVRAGRQEPRGVRSRTDAPRHCRSLALGYRIVGGAAVVRAGWRQLGSCHAYGQRIGMRGFVVMVVYGLGLNRRGSCGSGHGLASQTERLTGGCRDGNTREDAEYGNGDRSLCPTRHDRSIRRPLQGQALVPRLPRRSSAATPTSSTRIMPVQPNPLIPAWPVTRFPSCHRRSALRSSFPHRRERPARAGRIHRPVRPLSAS